MDFLGMVTRAKCGKRENKNVKNDFFIFPFPILETAKIYFCPTTHCKQCSWSLRGF
jgi:hypothetical protein